MVVRVHSGACWTERSGAGEAAEGDVGTHFRLALAAGSSVHDENAVAMPLTSR